MIVVLLAAGPVIEEGDIGRANRLDDLKVGLLLLLLALTLPLIGLLVGIGEVSASAGRQLTTVDAHKAAHGVVRAPSQGDQYAELIRRRAALELQRPTQV